MNEILYFSAPWCMPCKRFKPIMEQVGQSIPVRFVNVDESPQLATQYNIRNVPTLVYLKNGQEVDKSIGVLTESQIKEKWNLL
jgi:thioredoxin-like negative regulator of GroEL